MGIGICMEIGKLIGICKQMHVCVYADMYVYKYDKAICL